MSTPAIALETGLPAGQVELILSLPAPRRAWPEAAPGMTTAERTILWAYTGADSYLADPLCGHFLGLPIHGCLDANLAPLGRGRCRW